jgi:protein-tyrosine phosphatase
MSIRGSWVRAHLPFAANPAPAPTVGSWDCHCHILPGLDDGPRNVDEAMAMVRLAVENGTRTLIATPHHIEGFYPTLRSEVMERLAELRQRCSGEGLDVTLLPGHELALSPDLPSRITAGELLTLGDEKRAALIELPPLEPPPYWRHTFFDLRVRGITPIIAHADRTCLVSNADLAAEMVDAGAAFQINTGALCRKGTPRRVLDGWLRRGWVACIGSDAHDLRRRPPVVAIPEKMTAWRDLAAARPSFLFPGSTASA